MNPEIACGVYGGRGWSAWSWYIDRRDIKHHDHRDGVRSHSCQEIMDLERRAYRLEFELATARDVHAAERRNLAAVESQLRALQRKAVSAG